MHGRSAYLGDGEQDGVAVGLRRQPHVQGLIQTTRPQYGGVDYIYRRHLDSHQIITVGEYCLLRCYHYAIYGFMILF